MEGGARPEEGPPALVDDERLGVLQRAADRVSYDEARGRHDYRLTAKGRALMPGPGRDADGLLPERT